MNIIRSGRFRIGIGIGIGIGDFDSDADPKNIHTQRFRYDPKIVGADSDAAPIPKKVKFAHLYIFVLHLDLLSYLTVNISIFKCRIKREQGEKNIFLLY